ncbi:hypothetical protein A2837_03400 [Candidatus Kaiserbacteria bacterium RIFCSPHIGHO2_01_FULL_46_22]|uniref:Uncharacterized protein n=1 Tax=Candidatus Kaiserbacteria bacterium RIFCSPHIGHO2_01_FULL_46_22 TaxID=1798475 RepID=A0A1F6BX88_9BACT|nr:MAG: hypothetical protein A2837_03400 [Candidatus Kaiserbacteria bacterium RIFCSPHIGHO2_01_FULL_46_22]
MSKEYRDVRFKNDDEFEKYHKEEAKKGSEKSQAILSTRSRILLAEKFRASQTVIKRSRK